MKYSKSIMMLVGVVLISSCRYDNKMQMEDKAVKDEVWQTIQEMNRLWTKEDKAEELVNYFHERMIAITPADSFRIEGQKACVAGWNNFTKIANIVEWKEIDPVIELFGNNKFAIVAYNFSMKFEMNNDTIEMRGRDMFSLINEEDKWWIVSDQYSAFPDKL